MPTKQIIKQKNTGTGINNGKNLPIAKMEPTLRDNQEKVYIGPYLFSPIQFETDQ